MAQHSAAQTTGSASRVTGELTARYGGQGTCESPGRQAHSKALPLQGPRGGRESGLPGFELVRTRGWRL